MIDIATMVRKHNQEAVIPSLRIELNVINYKNLNVEKSDMKMIMNLAIEGGILRSPIDIDQFTDPAFSTKTTVQ